MSAFILGNEHISTIVNYAMVHKLRFYKTSEDPASLMSTEEIGQYLVDENRRSVNKRYRANAVPSVFTFIQPVGLAPAIQILKAISCYDYQSCENEDYTLSRAWRICNIISKTALKNIQGYNEAKWSLGW